MAFGDNFQFIDDYNNDLPLQNLKHRPKMAPSTRNHREGFYQTVLLDLAFDCERNKIRKSATYSKNLHIAKN